MTLIKVAFRNIVRNGRRSLMTIAAIAVGAVSMIIFGKFMGYVTKAFQTNTVEHFGHVTLFREGYFEFGAGNPAAYGISAYQDVIRTIRSDAALGPLVNVVTPTVNLFGIAGNYDIEVSKTFLGYGFVPSDRDRMLRWDEYGLFTNRPPRKTGLADDDPSGAVIGVGLARVLGLCHALRVPHCPEPPRLPRPAPAASTLNAEIIELASRERAAAPGAATTDAASPGEPRLDLLVSTAGGAPNVMSIRLVRAERQGVKELDDNFVGLNFSLAQELLYGRGEHKAVGIVLQLHRTEDIGLVRARLQALSNEHGWDLEARDFAELQPFYRQVVGMFNAIFSFMASIIAVIVLFTVVNTMTMSVVERTTEIGTARALGVRRAGIRKQFLIEGGMLGGMVAVAGLLFASLMTLLINHAGLTWTPPGQAAAVPLYVLSRAPALSLGVAVGLLVLSTLAALLPANRAARLVVVDALRHV
jgi:putative ABC transport system permease protein